MIVSGAGLQALYHKGVKIAEAHKFTIRTFAELSHLSLLELDADPEWARRTIHRERGHFPNDLADVVPRVDARADP